MNTDKSLVINLSKIAQKPKEFSFDHSHPLMREALFDLIKDNPFQINFTINRIGDAYELKGNLTAKFDLLCSKCAIDFKQEVSDKINELFMIQEKTGNYIDEKTSGGHQVFEDEIDESSPFCNLIDNQDLDLGEFCHELIALAEPFMPKAIPDCKEDCPNLAEFETYKKAFENNTESEFSPFSMLKNIKTSDSH